MLSLPGEKMALLGTVYIALNIWFFSGSGMECVVLGGPGSFFKSVLVLQYEFCLSTYHSPLSFSYLSILSHFPFVDIAIINVCYLHILCLLLYLSWKHWIFPLFFALFSAVRVPLLQQVFSSLFFSFLLSPFLFSLGWPFHYQIYFCLLPQTLGTEDW